MPRSRIRRKAAYTAPPTRNVRRIRASTWVAPVMLVSFIIGVLWLSVYYVTSGDVWGMRSLNGWNLVVGFAFIMTGFGLSTRWR